VANEKVERLVLKLGYWKWGYLKMASKKPQKMAF